MSISSSANPTSPEDVSLPPSTGGLFDGFEGYLTPTPEDYNRVLTEGMVVPDANVLLNLYRYTAEARNDLFAVLDRLGSRLWVPNHAVYEFWQNRESVLRDPRDTQKTVKELAALRGQAVQAFETWSNRVSLARGRYEELLGALKSGFETVLAGVEKFTDESAIKSARDTNVDAIVEKLSVTLKNRVGPPLGEAQHEAAIVEGLRRVAERIPPGYKDKNKDDEGAAGDFLVWEQTLIEAGTRSSDVLFITGDVKEDWWRIEGGERRGPRLELIEEMRGRTGRRLFMLRPTRLLEYARKELVVSIREESVQDADRVDKLVSEFEKDLPDGGWDDENVEDLLFRLSVEAPVQFAALRLAAQQNGFVSREQVYELGGYPEDRSLRGFTRPINRLAQELRDHGFLPEGAVDLLWAVYDEQSPGVGWASGFRIHSAVVSLLHRASGAHVRAS